MSLHRKVILTAAAAASLASSAWAYDFGRPAAPDEIKLWDIDVRPDGAGLPQGSGTVAHGKEVYQDNCEVCHGTNGEGGIKDRLVGGEGTLASSKPLKTVGSYWPYATTLFDYIRRAMPYPIPGHSQRRRYLCGFRLHPELESRSCRPTGRSTKKRCQKSKCQIGTASFRIRCSNSMMSWTPG